MMTTLEWQWAQVLATWPAFTVEALSAAPRMLCSPWQLVQTGASVMPLARALPCTEAEYWAKMARWQVPHTWGMFVRWTWDRGVRDRAK